MCFPSGGSWWIHSESGRSVWASCCSPFFYYTSLYFIVLCYKSPDFKYVIKTKLISGRFVDQTFQVVERVRASAPPGNFLTPPWAGTPRLRTIVSNNNCFSNETQTNDLHCKWCAGTDFLKWKPCAFVLLWRNYRHTRHVLLAMPARKQLLESNRHWALRVVSETHMKMPEPDVHWKCR